MDAYLFEADYWQGGVGVFIRADKVDKDINQEKSINHRINIFSNCNWISRTTVIETYWKGHPTRHIRQQQNHDKIPDFLEGIVRHHYNPFLIVENFLFNILERPVNMSCGSKVYNLLMQLGKHFYQECGAHGSQKADSPEVEAVFSALLFGQFWEVLLSIPVYYRFTRRIADVFFSFLVWSSGHLPRWWIST